MGGFWTADRIDVASKLWKEGKTLTEIAVALGNGATKNSIAGKIDRLGLMNTRPKPLKKIAPPKGNVPGRRSIRTSRASPNVVDLPARSKRQNDGIDTSKVNVSSPFSLPESYIGFMDLTASSCRWPFESPQATFYCGSEAIHGHSYCHSHHCMSIGRKRARILKAA